MWNADRVIGLLLILAAAALVVNANLPGPPAPEPVVAAPEVGELMAGYTVSGAGDGSYNGDYTDNGSTENGATVYEIGSGGRYLYVGGPLGSGGTSWVLYDTITEAHKEAYDYYNGTTSAPDAGSWSTATGTDPAPSVTAGETEGVDYEVSGAAGGTGDCADANGSYVEIGTWNGRPQYQNENGVYLFWASAIIDNAADIGPGWVLMRSVHTNPEIGSMMYYTQADTPDLGGWLADQCPPPTPDFSTDDSNTLDAVETMRISDSATLQEVTSMDAAETVVVSDAATMRKMAVLEGDEGLVVSGAGELHHAQSMSGEETVQISDSGDLQKADSIEAEETVEISDSAVLLVERQKGQATAEIDWIREKP